MDPETKEYGKEKTKQMEKWQVTREVFCNSDGLKAVTNPQHLGKDAGRQRRALAPMFVAVKMVCDAS